jgi:MCM6 C-terminal winged-helix domain
MEKEQR